MEIKKGRRYLCTTMSRIQPNIPSDLGRIVSYEDMASFVLLANESKAAKDVVAISDHTVSKNMSENLGSPVVGNVLSYVIDAASGMLWATYEVDTSLLSEEGWLLFSKGDLCGFVSFMSHKTQDTFTGIVGVVMGLRDREKYRHEEVIPAFHRILEEQGND